MSSLRLIGMIAGILLFVLSFLFFRGRKWNRLDFFLFFDSGLFRPAGVKDSDPSSGFRAFKMDAVRQIPLDENQFHTSELIISGAKSGFRIHEAPITILKRKYGKSKKGRNGSYGVNFAKIVIRSGWRQV